MVAGRGSTIARAQQYKRGKRKHPKTCSNQTSETSASACQPRWRDAPRKANHTDAPNSSPRGCARMSRGRTTTAYKLFGRGRIVGMWEDLLMNSSWASWRKASKRRTNKRCSCRKNLSVRRAGERARLHLRQGTTLHAGDVGAVAFGMLGAAVGARMRCGSPRGEEHRHGRWAWAMARLAAE